MSTYPLQALVSYLEGRLHRAVIAQQQPTPEAPSGANTAPRPLTLPTTLRAAITDYKRDSSQHRTVRSTNLIS